MASAAGTNQVMAALDQPIVIKVSIEDTVRRFKIPLSDVTPSKFADKLRQLLQIAPSKQLLLERYSDSASSYITLDVSNSPSYKQLYRAAKAKSKLRLKATVFEEPKVPKKTSPATDGMAALDPALAPLNEALDKLKLNVAPQAPAPGSAWHVCCNNCDKPMLDSHYHCSTCENGDYDLCEACVSRGVTCLVGEHWLIKRNIRNGQVFNSTTERRVLKLKPTALSGPPPAAAAAAAAAPAAAAAKNVALGAPVSVPSVRATVPPASVTFTATVPEKTIPGSFASESKVLPAMPEEANRTCNACVKVLPEKLLVNCSDCQDFDLCIACIKDNSHGHHPGHRFTAIADEKLAANVQTLCAPGRGEAHWATCDGCDQRISGVRHKCLDCPDWDLCSKCHVGAATTHPKHRFVPVYDKMSWALPRKAHHDGVYCDGPLCRADKVQSYVQGVRYKCSICHDTDFCANCEAHPSNKHNASHPLIMFKTPVKSASISTLGESPLGLPTRIMGDRYAAADAAFDEALRIPPIAPVSALPCGAGYAQAPTCGQGKHVFHHYTSTREAADANDRKPAPLPKPKQVEGSELDAHFVCDTVADGTVFTPNREFQQIWSLRNPGPHTWPVGVAVRNTGGDNMLNIDPFRPASSSELSTAQCSQATDVAIGPNEHFPFEVTLRSPLSPGKHISYWRARAPDGTPFGHKLWCEIEVQDDAPALHVAPMPASAGFKSHTDMSAESAEKAASLADYQMQLMALESQGRKRQRAIEHEGKHQQRMERFLSRDHKIKDEDQGLASTMTEQMIFPKLDKESPSSSTNLEAKNVAAPPHNDLDSVEFDDDSDDETFLTDDEYDILDASDEEVVVDNGVPVTK